MNERAVRHRQGYTKDNKKTESSFILTSRELIPMAMPTLSQVGALRVATAENSIVSKLHMSHIRVDN